MICFRMLGVLRVETEECGAVGAAVANGQTEGSIGEIIREIEPSVKNVKGSQPSLTTPPLVVPVSYTKRPPVWRAVIVRRVRTASFRSDTRARSLRCWC